MLSAWVFFPLLWWQWWRFSKAGLFYSTPLKGVTNQSVCSLLEKSAGKKVFPYKFFLATLNPNSHFFGFSVLGCSSAYPQQGLCSRYSCSQSLLLDPSKCSVLSPPTPHRSYPLCGHQPWSCLGRSLRVWSGKTFLHDVFNCPLIWVWCNVLWILKTLLEASNGWNKSTYGSLSFHNQPEARESGECH